MSSWEKYLFRSFAHFLIGLFGFFGIEFCKFFINFGFWHLIRCIANMFSHSVDCLFILLMISFAVQKLFSLMKSYFFIFFLLFPLPGEIDTSDKNFLWVMSEILLHMFSSRIFMISDWTFKSLIHFEFIVVCGVRRWSSFIFLHVSVQFSQHHLLNKLSLAHYMCFLSLLNMNWL